MVIFQQPTQAFFTADSTVNAIHCLRSGRKQQYIVFTLMITFSTIMDQVLTQRTS